ncbi:MAG: hypothetical protein QG635_78 [Bacteroidota bacterium]|nr:hypothetical protein [Bacteroidota bacterium]
MKADYSNMSDNELVVMLDGKKSLSEAAFTALYDRYSKKVFAYIIKIIGDKEAAEDIFQETFLRFFQNVRSNFQGGCTMGFLITIARNLCLNFKRDKKSNVPIESYEYLFNEQPSQELEQQELVRMALDLLEFEYREPLVLFVYNGMKYEDIAQICGISIGNARLRVHRAKEKIKNILTPYLKEFC